MKVKKERLAKYLNEYGISAAEFAKKLGIDTAEVEKMLNGEKVNRKTAERFIYYLGADRAQEFVDWSAIGKANPFKGGKA